MNSFQQYHSSGKIVYAIWKKIVKGVGSTPNSEVLCFSQSRDNGQKWESPIILGLFDDSTEKFLDVDEFGTVYVVSRGFHKSELYRKKRYDKLFQHSTVDHATLAS